MSEGRRHKKAKTRTIDALGLHFRSIGRDVYLAEEMAVLYPGEPVFIPDVLAVLDVAEPEDDPRMAWVVADEGKGLNLVIDVLHHGDRDKDLVANVERYASLGAPEYFVYDRLHQQIFGYRLPDARADEAQAHAAQALAALRGGITALLAARGVVCAEEDRAQIVACNDASVLQKWLLRATTATSAREVFSG